MSLAAELAADAERQKIKEEADLIAYHKAKAIECLSDETMSKWHASQAMAALGRLREMALSRVEGAAQ